MAKMGEGSRLWNEQLAQAAKDMGWGMSIKDVAVKYDVSIRTVYNWMSREDFAARRNKECNRFIASLKPKAFLVFREQMDEDNPWVRQNAAGQAARFCAQYEGIGTTTVNVVFGSMPDPGMPPDESDEAESDDV
jgi:hypothetical protein